VLTLSSTTKPFSVYPAPGFSGKCDVMREKNSRLFELARLLMRSDNIASFIVNANHSIL
jgi:hypothetical protein